MKVSIVIPYYNDRDFLPQAIESVLNQSFEDFELILVNHATTDDCREIAHSYKDPRIVHLDMEKNYGAGTGLVLRRVLEFAKGEYMKLFCADDILYKHGLKTLVEYMESHPDKDFAFGGVDYIDKEGKYVKPFIFKKTNFCDGKQDEIDSLRAFFHGYGFLPYIGNIIKMNALKNVEVDVSFIAQFDMHLWLTLLVKNYKIGFLDNSVAGWRIHADQMSGIKNLKKMNRCRDIEHIKYIEPFFQIKDAGLLKKIFPNNLFLKKLKNPNEQDINFIISYEMFNSLSDGICYRGYFNLYDMLHDTNTRNYLEEKFHFGIKEFREIYLADKPKKTNSRNIIAAIFKLIKFYIIIRTC